MKIKMFVPVLMCIFMFSACSVDQEYIDRQIVDQQQKQYAASQPIPMFNWSLERHLIIQLYQARNSKVATHSVWRSDYGMVEGDCSSIGFSIAADTSLTNPLQREQGTNSAVIEQAEPNGLFASKNTNATWVMCTGEGGVINPVRVESKVTTYPYPVTVDYPNNRVYQAGKSSLKITTQ
jgi:hypothetical protein